MDQLTCMLARKMVGPAPNLGSGLIDQSQKMTVAARAMAEKKAPGLLASARRKGHLERARRLLSVTPPPAGPIDDAEPKSLCPCCSGTMVIIEVLERRYLARAPPFPPPSSRSEEHTSELQSLMRISYAVFCLKKKKKHNTTQ